MSKLNASDTANFYTKDETDKLLRFGLQYDNAGQRIQLTLNDAPVKNAYIPLADLGDALIDYWKISAVDDEFENGG
jgi:hypothetical protein